MDNSDNLMKIRNLRSSFGDLEVLKGIDLDIPRGQTTCIVGTSGSGKSTLIRHMTGLLQADSGQLMFDGRDLTTMSPRNLESIRKDFGMVFQYSALLGSMSVYDNVALPLVEMRKMHRSLRKQYTQEYIHKRVMECLDVVRLNGFEHALPAELSGGMRKRCGMARAIVTRPKVIFYDEPTSGLDPVISAMIHALIAELSHKYGVTNIVITHDLEKSFEIADRAAMIFEGKIIFSGTIEEFETCDHPAVNQLLTGDINGPLTSAETAQDAKTFTPSSTQMFKIQAIKDMIKSKEKDGPMILRRGTGVILPVIAGHVTPIGVQQTKTDEESTNDTGEPDHSDSAIPSFGEHAGEDDGETGGENAPEDRNADPVDSADTVRRREDPAGGNADTRADAPST